MKGCPRGGPYSQTVNQWHTCNIWIHESYLDLFIFMQIPNILTPKDCKAIIASAEAKGFYHLTQLDNLRSYGGAIFVDNEESYPPLYMPHIWRAPWTREVHFTRTNGIYKANHQLHDLCRLLWTPVLKAAFEGIALKGFKDVHAIGIECAMIHRY